MTIYQLGVGIPVSLPLGNTASELQAYQNNLADKITYMISKANAGENILKEQVLLNSQADQ